MLQSSARTAYRLLGPYVQKYARREERLARSLQRAHLTLRPDVYLSYTALLMIACFGVGLLGLSIALGLHAAGAVRLDALALGLLVPLPVLLAGCTYLVARLLPDLRAAERGRDIDAKLPYAVNYINIMSSAGVAPHQIFASVAEQPLYGEVANEAAWISRDLDLLGKDLMGALTDAMERSPSLKFQDFLQGIITSLASGKNLKEYLAAKARQYLHDNRQRQKQFQDTVSVLAESYVTVVVAAPLLLIVLLTVMLMFGGNVGRTFTLGYLLLLVFLPLTMFAFGATIKGVTPEA